MVAGTIVASVFGWRYRRRVPGSFVLWAAIVFATGVWWVKFRYLRYLLPEAFRIPCSASRRAPAGQRETVGAPRRVRRCRGDCAPWGSTGRS
jgi:hypothetical protein